MRDWPPEWSFLPVALADFRGTILVLAPGDRGKSTLVRLLYTFFLSRKRRVGWVDADLGQSTVGPPTVVGLLLSRGSEASLEERLFTPYFRFVGDITPESEIVATACYTAELVRFALLRSDVVLVDTCGLFSCPSGYLLKTLKIRLVHPQIVLAIGEKGDFVLWEKFLGDRLVVLPIPEGVTEKRSEWRRGYRRQLFARYFTRGKIVQLPLGALRFSLPIYPFFFESCLHHDGENVVFRVRGERLAVSPDGMFLVLEKRSQRVPLSGALCGIFSEAGEELGLGIIKSIDLKGQKFTVWGTLLNPGKPEAIVLGNLRLDERGEEKERWVLFSSPLRPERWEIKSQ